MQYLGLLFTLSLLVTNLWGAALAVGWFWRQRWVAIALAPWTVTTAFYAIECYRGLGDLRAFGLLGTIASIGMIFASASIAEPVWLSDRLRERLVEWRREFAPKRLLDCGGIFLGIFGYAFLWRFA